VKYLLTRNSLRNTAYLGSFNHCWLKAQRLFNFDELVLFSLILVFYFSWKLGHSSAAVVASEFPEISISSSLFNSCED